MSHRLLLGVVLLGGLVGTGHGQEPAAPKSAPPNFVQVGKVNRAKGQLHLRLVQSVPVTETREREVVRGGVKVRETYTVIAHRSMVRETEVTLASHSFYDVEGKEISGDDLWKKLTVGKILVQQIDRTFLDPAYRKVLAKDALILAPKGAGPAVEPK